MCGPDALDRHPGEHRVGETGGVNHAPIDPKVVVDAPHRADEAPIATSPSRRRLSLRARRAQPLEGPCGRHEIRVAAVPLGIVDQIDGNVLDPGPIQLYLVD